MLEASALALSIAALIISYASLYLTSVRAAEIELDPVNPEPMRLGAFAQPGPWPEHHRAEAGLLISNAGARGGLLDRVWLGDFSSGGGEPYWVEGELRASLPGAVPLAPHAIEAGDVIAGHLLVVLSPAALEPEEMAARVGALEALTVTIRWTFIRTRGLSVRWRVVPKSWRRRRERVERSTTVNFDTSEWRARAIEHWGQYEDFVPLAQIAEAAGQPG